LEASQQFSFLQGRVVSPTPNSHPGGPKCPFSYEFILFLFRIKREEEEEEEEYILFQFDE
jgi:hypothetical protein